MTKITILKKGAFSWDDKMTVYEEGQEVELSKGLAKKIIEQALNYN